jgi:hypothetical protein
MLLKHPLAFAALRHYRHKPDELGGAAVAFPVGRDLRRGAESLVDCNVISYAYIYCSLPELMKRAHPHRY